MTAGPVNGIAAAHGGAMVEIAIRTRCSACGLAVEWLHMSRAPHFPATLEAKVPLTLADGWTAEGGKLWCPDHPPTRVVTAQALPAAGPVLVRR